MKEVLFHPSVQKTLKAMPKGIRKTIGELVYGLQMGERYTMPVSRSMPLVGKGVEELRVKDASGAYRVFYIANFDDKSSSSCLQEEVAKDPKKRNRYC